MAIGDHLRTRIKLWGAPSCVDTAKCLMTAADKGVDLEALLFDPDSSEVKTMSPFGIGPIIKDVNYVVVGVYGILSYLDDKGFGPLLTIRNGVVRSKQWELSHLATDVLQKNLDNEEVVAKFLAHLDEHLRNRGANMRGDFVCGLFSLADVHLAANINKLSLDGKQGAISSHGNVSAWLNAVRTHTATSKDQLVPYDSLPTGADVQANRLRDVEVNVGS